METLLKASAYILGATGSSIVYRAMLADDTALAVRRIGESGGANNSTSSRTSRSRCAPSPGSGTPTSSASGASTGAPTRSSSSTTTLPTAASPTSHSPGGWARLITYATEPGSAAADRAGRGAWPGIHPREEGCARQHEAVQYPARRLICLHIMAL